MFARTKRAARALRPSSIRSRARAATITVRTIRAARRRDVVVLSRRQWGSKQGDVYANRRRWTREGVWGAFRLQADTVVQHITDTRRSGDFKADCRIVEQIGMDRFGSGVSYNWLVDMVTGVAAAGQPLDSKGTHTVNEKRVPGYSRDQNMRARAIVVVGRPGDKLSPAAERTIVGLLAAMVETGAVTPGFDYEPHSLFAPKDCPCGPTRSRMPAIRRAVARAVAGR